MNHSTVTYHPKLLKVFTREELDILEAESSYSLDSQGRVNVMIVSRDNMMVEIFTDCEASEIDHALIVGLDGEGTLTSEQFWKLYYQGKNQPMTCLTIDE